MDNKILQVKAPYITDIDLFLSNLAEVNGFSGYTKVHDFTEPGIILVLRDSYVNPNDIIYGCQTIDISSWFDNFTNCINVPDRQTIAAKCRILLDRKSNLKIDKFYLNYRYMHHAIFMEHILSAIVNGDLTESQIYNIIDCTNIKDRDHDMIEKYVTSLRAILSWKKSLSL